MPLKNGYLLNQRYRIVDILGQGGMGAVYRAIDENLDITVAVKENSFFSEEYARQFQLEAKILATLRHPNLPRVFDYFVIDQQGQYLVMDYIEGEDLRQWMSRDDNIPEIDALNIGISICDALIYLHSKTPAITHRDIKPGNIKISPEGEVVLVDFGLVKILRDKELTTNAARAMTPGYSPPEQYGEVPTDHRSDIFSLGATLYAALACYLPEDSLERTTGQAQLTPLRHYNKQVSTKTARVIEKALELRFEDRWQSAEAFKAALLEAREALPPDKLKDKRIMVSNTQEITGWGDHASDSKGENPTQKLEKLVARGKQWLDPVWFVFGLLILLLLSMLGVSLLRPEGIQGVFLRSFESSPTATSQVFASQFSSTTLSLPTPEETHTPTALPSLTVTVTATVTASVTATVEVPTEVIPSQTPRGGGRGMLAFVSERTGTPQIWLLDIASGNPSQLTFLNDGACQPDWSPNGDRIVFTSPCPGKRTYYPGSSLFIIEVENGDLTPLMASLEGDFDPAWSPDGEWIVYTSLINTQRQLLKINLKDLSIVKLSDGSYHDSQPAWSPDGDRLAFVRIRTVAQIWLMDADGENQEQFTRSGLIDNSKPTWFAKENLILYSQVLGSGSPSKQLYGMRLEDIGQEEEYQVLPTTRSDYIPLMDNVDVSPDGFWLAFDYWYFDVLSDIYIMAFPGANLIQMTEHPEMDYDPVWRPSS